MGLLDFLLRRQPDPTKDWPDGTGSLPTVRLHPFAIGALRLDAPVDSARFLGQPERVKRYKVASCYRLIYEKLGMTLEFQGHQLTEVAFAIGDTWLATEGMGRCKLRFEDGSELTDRSTIDDVKRRFGAPKEELFDEVESETELRYAEGKESMTFEFDREKKLTSWVVVWD
jgi:hypothetical protein